MAPWRRPASSSLIILECSLLTLVSLSGVSDASLRLLIPNQTLAAGDTLVSRPHGVFELGFFTPGGSTNLYLGIWYKQIPVFTPVWVANREAPLSEPSGVLTISAAGELILLDGGGRSRVLWRSNTLSAAARNPVAELLDSGNLVVRDEGDDDPDRFSWQSFDHPTDTWLPGMKFAVGGAGAVSWKNPSDPFPGDFSVRMNTDERMHQLDVWERSRKRYSAGMWNGLTFSGKPEMLQSVYEHRFVSDGGAGNSYMVHHPKLHGLTLTTRFVVVPSGNVVQLYWANKTRSWEVAWSALREECDIFGSCGPNGVCDLRPFMACGCLEGFRPSSPEAWEGRDWSGGCVRERELRCGKRDSFQRVEGLKMPDVENAVVDRAIGMEMCHERCSMNCSCVAFAAANLSDGSGCVLWYGDLVDVKRLVAGGQELHLRLAAGEIENGVDVKHQRNGMMLKTLLQVALVLVPVSILFLGVFVYLVGRKLSKDSKQGSGEHFGEIFSLLPFGTSLINDGNKTTDFSIFKFDTVLAATNNFSDMNKLGEGGFGPVHKGILSDGQKVAVKRLSDSSVQGLVEFKNEVMLIARIQHVNLIRLLGCCVYHDERMLVYDYMPNRSLDSILFDPKKKAILDWGRRRRIIDGIAQGLLYLHKYSRLRIIHRDLKASNILLDSELNPKISDFGMARIFCSDQNHERTRRIVGTYGYMPPEYAFLGLFSEKSDVFSFGVLLLEIVSGKKSSGFHHIKDSWNLLAHVWDLWERDRALEIADEDLAGPRAPSEIQELLRCVQVGLLCVQMRAEERPAMAAVVRLLGEAADLPAPKQPAFCDVVACERQEEHHDDHAFPAAGTSNDVTISYVDAR